MWRKKKKERKRRWKMLIGLFVVAHVIGFFSSIDAVMRTRTAQGTIAWALSLNFIPIVAVPAYWVFGRSKFQGYVTLRQITDSELAHRWQELRKRLEDRRFSDFRIPEAGRAGESMAKMPMVAKNRVELLIDGEATFDSILAGIDEAKVYVLIQFYIVHDDELGRKVQDQLIAKAKQGVRIYYLYDEIGSHDLPDSHIKKLRDTGILMHDFHTRKGPGNRFQVNFRNHRKIVVVDGRVAWVGGHNVGDEYMGKDPKIGRWRDTHVRIEGPAAAAAQLSFVEDWHWATDQILELDWSMHPTPDGNANVLILPTGPADEYETAALMFTHAINTAKERLWIASPYFVPEEGIVHALQLASLRGVDVRILIPDKSDNAIADMAAASFFEELAAAGITFYRYTDGFLHAKSVLIDDLVAGIGTANFDNRSFRLNFEIMAFVAEPEFIELVQNMFEADFANSRRMEPGEYNARSFWYRLGARLSRLTAPVQ
jgi:cardiolipin synthase